MMRATYCSTMTTALVVYSGWSQLCMHASARQHLHHVKGTQEGGCFACFSCLHTMQGVVPITFLTAGVLERMGGFVSNCFNALLLHINAACQKLSCRPATIGCCLAVRSDLCGRPGGQSLQSTDQKRKNLCH
jgi:hypothetical protein